MPIMLAIIWIIVLLSQPVHASCLYYSPGETYAPPTSSGTTYYVDGTNGNDSWTGTAPAYTNGTTGPWKTLTKALDRYTNRGAGTRILIRTGIYYGHFSIPGAPNWTQGTDDASRHIVAAYGDGPVIIDASITPNLGAWSVYSGQIYQSTFSVVPAGVQAVVIDDDFKTYHPVASLDAITADGDWFYDSSTHVLYVQTPVAIGDPTTHDLVVIKNDGGINNSEYALYANSGSHWLTVSGLTIRGCAGFGFWANNNQSHITIDRCKTMFNGKAGIWFTRNSQTADPIVSNYPIITKNFVYGNIMLNWPRGSWDGCQYINGGWPPAITLANGDGIASGNVIIDNGGEGIIPADAPGNHIIEDNIVANNWNMGIYIISTLSPIVRRNVVFNNTSTSSNDVLQTCSNTGTHPTLYEKAVGHLRQDGIVTADEGGGTTLPVYYSGGRFYNNLLLFNRRGFAHYADNYLSGVKDTQIINNTIVLPDSNYYDNAGPYAGLKFSNSYGYNSASFMRNNIVIAQDDNNLDAYFLLNGTQSPDGITWDYNLYYHGTSSAPFEYRGGTPMAFAPWQGVISGDANSQFADPLLTRSNWSIDVVANAFPQTASCTTVEDYMGIPVSDFIPQSGSPARGMGADVSAFLTTDFQGASNPVPMGVGALVYGSTPPVGSDTTPPVTTSSPAAGTYNPAQYIALSATDSQSGVANTYYCLGAGCTPTTVYTGTITMTSSQVLRYYSVDNAGNNEAIHTDTYNIVDSQAPTVTTFNISSVSSSLTVPVVQGGFVATDNLAVTAYCVTIVNDSTACTWSPTIPSSVTFQAQGAQTAYGWAKDNAGNVSASRSSSTTITLPSSVDGVCGSAAGGHFYSLTAYYPYLCSAGSVDDFTALASSWTWTCGGVNGGTDATCTPATLLTGSETIFGGSWYTGAIYY